MNRKVLSKKARFNIMKYDNFTCQYCGRKSPEVKLHIDHIIPLAKGGEDNITNYITSCEDCNEGKGTTLVKTERTPLLESRYVKAAEREALELFYASYKKSNNPGWISSSTPPDTEIDCWISGISTVFTFDRELTCVDPPTIYPFEIPMVTYNPIDKRWERDESWYIHLGYAAPKDRFNCVKYKTDIKDNGNTEILYSLDENEKYYYILKINILAYYPYPNRFWRKEISNGSKIPM